MKPFLVVIAIHFVLMALAMSKIEIYSNNPAWEAVRWYGRFTGSSATYSFFSPDVQPMVNVRFVIHLKDGRKIETTLQESSNNEVTARLQNVLRTIPNTFKNHDAVRSVIASLTASVFREYPDAEKIDVTSLLYIEPTMTEYTNGARPEYKKTYSATYRRRADQT